MFDKGEITLYTLSFSLLLLFEFFSLCRVLDIRCPHLTGKGHSLVLSHRGKPRGLRREALGAPLLPKNRVRKFIQPKQFGPFFNRLSLPYPDEEILFAYEEDVSSIRDGFSA